jgi:hypothetical protein
MDPHEAIPQLTSLALVASKSASIEELGDHVGDVEEMPLGLVVLIEEVDNGENLPPVR